MKISSKQYALSLYELIVDKDETIVVDILKNFVDFTIKNNDYGKIDEIISEFSKIWDEDNSNLSVNITSAHKLEDETKSIVINYLKNKTGFSNINLIESIDTDIMGGVVLHYADKVIDGSIKNNLNNLKNKINK
jgi:F-type H+-transporting ATPase subunit delta